jgi:hypothetical protein
MGTPRLLISGVMIMKRRTTCDKRNELTTLPARFVFYHRGGTHLRRASRAVPLQQT